MEAALEAGLEALGIADHDTFAGYDQAAPLAGANGLELICGIEVNTRLAAHNGDHSRAWSVHVLGYFLHEPPSMEFREWLSQLLESRRERNTKLLEKLRSMGVLIDLEEVQAIGRTLTGRPHFARLLVHKGYAANSEDAFRRYLGESSPGFVQRDSPHAALAIQQIVAAGGLPVLAHPVRLGIRNPTREAEIIGELRDAGLRGIEAYHSDHGPSDVERYLELARKLGLAVSGGSDFHGSAKPRVMLGTGIDRNLNVPRKVLTELRRFRAA